MAAEVEKKQNKPKISPETIELIRKMAKENRLWGAERIRGELLKLGIKVCKRTIQKYLPKVGNTPSSSQTWATFVRNHAQDIWACDFTAVYDWLFRQWYIFVVMEHKTRRVLHTAITKFPTDDWTAQQLREATPWGKGPKYLIHDRDNKYGSHFSGWSHRPWGITENYYRPLIKWQAIVPKRKESLPDEEPAWNPSGSIGMLSAIFGLNSV